MKNNLWRLPATLPATTTSRLKDETIREWYDRLFEGCSEIELYKENLCPVVKANWPYISTTLKNKNFSPENRNFHWENQALQIMKLHAPLEDFIIVTFGPEMVFGFSDEVTALSARLSLTFTDAYDVEFGF